MQATCINGRWTLLLPEHRAARPQWDPANGGWETQRLAAMYDAIAPGQLVFDVGAEEGDLSGLFATWGARLVLVEPDPKVWPNMRAIWRANSLPSPVGCYVGFCSDTPRLAAADDLDYLAPQPDGWPACAHGPVIGDHGFERVEERPDRAATTVDLLAAAHGTPDHVTMDVEGSELLVMRGATETLARRRTTWWVSVHPQFMADTYGHDADDLHRLMRDAGYDADLLAVDHEQHWRYTP